MSQESICYSPPLDKSSFLFYKRPSQAWTQRFSRLRTLKDLSASVRFTMELTVLYKTLSTSRALLLPKFEHCVAIANKTRYLRTLRILGVKESQPLGRTARLMRKEKSLQELGRLPPLHQRQSVEGFLDLPRRITHRVVGA